MELITDAILKYISKNNAIDGTDNDVVAFYKYGIEITLSSLFNIVVILLLSLLFNGMIEGFIFLAVLIPTRQFTGGFHADTYLKCNLVFGLSYIITLHLFRYTCNMVNVYISILLLAVEIFFVSVVCPINNEHKPIHERKQYVRSKIISVVLYLFFGLIGLYFIFISNLYGNMILYSLHLITVLGILGILKERRKENEKAKQSS